MAETNGPVPSTEKNSGTHLHTEIYSILQRSTTYKLAILGSHTHIILDTEWSTLAASHVRKCKAALLKRQQSCQVLMYKSMRNK